MYKYFSVIFLALLIFYTPSYANEQAISLNQEVIILKQQVNQQIDALRSNLTKIDIQFTELDHKTKQMEVNAMHPTNSSEFLVINKILFALLLASCVGIGMLLRIFFSRAKVF